jgi:hypothetical protein
MIWFCKAKARARQRHMTNILHKRGEYRVTQKIWQIPELGSNMAKDLKIHDFGILVKTIPNVSAFFLSHQLVDNFKNKSYYFHFTNQNCT